MSYLRNNNLLLQLVFIALGFTTMIGQIVLLRELIIFFTGNELVIGIILAVWLLWTAFGSGVLGRWITHRSAPLIILILTQLALSVIIPLTFILIKQSKMLFSMTAGEVFTPILIFVIPTVSLSFIGSITGFLYPVCCKILAQTIEKKSTAAGKIYLFEAIGSGVAGFVASIFLFRYLENFQVAIILSGVHLTIAVLLGFYYSKRAWQSIAIVSIIILLLIVLFFPSLYLSLEQRSWRPIQLLETKSTLYGVLAVTRLADTINFYENGVFMYSYPDLMASEESVHFVLLQHPEPKTVLLIGGNGAGNIPQILMHPSVSRIDFVLLDPVANKLAGKHIPEFDAIMKDHRVHFYFMDGRLFLHQSPRRYDAIIIDLPAPQTTLINRFFTREFYQKASAKMNSDGVIGFNISSSDHYIGDEEAELLSCLYHTLQSVFPDLILIPGYTIHFIACKTSGILTHDHDILAELIENRTLATQFIRDYYLKFRLTDEKKAYLNSRIRSESSTLLNRDFRPVGYFNNIYLWLSTFNPKLISAIHHVKQLLSQLGAFLLLLFIIFTVMLTFYLRKKQKLNQFNLTLSIFLIGSTSISLEVLIIHVFQAIYGYAYFQISLILSSFMFGLALGSWFSLRKKLIVNQTIHRYFGFQLLLFLYPLLTLITAYALAKFVLPGFVIQTVVFLLISGLGFICGHQFPIANDLLYQKSRGIERVGGALYAWDLVGALVGVLFISTVLIPFLGVVWTCLLYSLLNLIPIGIYLFIRHSAT